MKAYIMQIDAEEGSASIHIFNADVQQIDDSFSMNDYTKRIECKERELNFDNNFTAQLGIALALIGLLSPCWSNEKYPIWVKFILTIFCIVLFGASCVPKTRRIMWRLVKQFGTIIGSPFVWIGYLIKKFFFLVANFLRERFGNVLDSLRIPGFRLTFIYKGVEFAFRYCPSGTYIMGSRPSEDHFEREYRYKVIIPIGFWMCETPTTQALWKAVMGENNSSFKGEKLPVETVSLEDCKSFVDKLNSAGISPKGWRFELPAQELWEYACRAGTTGSNYGIPVDECAWYDKNAEGKTHEVGLKKPNNWGIYDMLGNVCEWTTSKNDLQPDVHSYVARGGSWFHDVLISRPANRTLRFPSQSFNYLGFRLVLVSSRLNRLFRSRFIDEKRLTEYRDRLANTRTD